VAHKISIINYCQRTIGKPKNRWTDAVNTDTRKQLGTAGWKRLALEQNIEEATTRNWAVIKLQQKY